METGKQIVRRLAAIMSIDVVGYSRLMSGDESGTHLRLKTHRIERIEPAVRRHGGRLIKLTGDGALIEFASAVVALSAAVEIQQAMVDANRHQPADTAIVFRIGIDLGDLMVDDNELYGDGVNIAVRLEGAAPPGGVLISGNVHDADGRLLSHDIAAQAHAGRPDRPAPPPAGGSGTSSSKGGTSRPSTF